MSSVNADHKYDDIIHLPRHVSTKRAPMSMVDRAAQFSPFAALTGYDGVIRETARLTDSDKELDESSKVELNEKLQIIAGMIEQLPEVTIVHFQKDLRKAGGAYISTTGRVKKIDLYEQEIVLTDRTRIPIDGIYQIDSPVLQQHLY